MTEGVDRATERVVAGRQKVHDREMSVAGYEYVFGTVSAGRISDDSRQSMVTSHELLLDRGAEVSKMLGSLRTFCTADRDVLTSGAELSLPVGSVIEVACDDADSDVVAACKTLADNGFVIAASGLPTNAHSDLLFDLASIVKVDTQAHARDELARIAEACRARGVELMAANVETLPQFHHVRRLDFDLFQGPAVQTVYSAFRASARPASISQLRLAVELLGDQLEFDDIESMLRPEPHLTYQVMQLASLGRMGEMRRSISTIRDALVNAGLWRIQHWIAVLSAFPADADNEDRVFETLLRASACEYLAGEQLGRGATRMAFAAGVLSSFADLLEPRGAGLASLDLSPELRDAAFGNETPLARIVRDVVEYQSGATSQRRWSNVTREEMDLAFASAFLWAVEATATAH